MVETITHKLILPLTHGLNRGLRKHILSNNRFNGLRLLKTLFFSVLCDT